MLKLWQLLLLTSVIVLVGAWIGLQSHECNNNVAQKKIEYVRNYDGDTIVFNVPYWPAIVGEKISIRVRGIDTPEIRSKSSCEKKKAIEARDLVKGILSEAREIKLESPDRGKYFRVVADVLVDGFSVKDILLSKHLAIPYDGGRKRSYDWCESKPTPQVH